MVVDIEVKASKNEVSFDDDTSKVSPSINDLVIKLDSMNNSLISQDKFLKRAAHVRKEFKDKLELSFKELEAAKKCVVVVFDEVECDKCAIHMSSLLCLMSMMS